jgi:hypothetical protein
MCGKTAQATWVQWDGVQGDVVKHVEVLKLLNDLNNVPLGPSKLSLSVDANGWFAGISRWRNIPKRGMTGIPVNSARFLPGGKALQTDWFAGVECRDARVGQSQLHKFYVNSITLYLNNSNYFHAPIAYDKQNYCESSQSPTPSLWPLSRKARGCFP